MNKMKRFPNKLTPNNINNLKEFHRNRLKCYLRKYIYEKMLSGDFNIPDNCGINLQEISFGHFSEISYNIDITIVNELCKELNKIGWETQIGMGNTLYIYTADKIPHIINTKIVY